MAPHWVWGNCNAFREDPDFCFEGLSVPPLTLLFFYWNGKLHAFNSPRQWFVNRSSHDLDRWHFEAGSGSLKFVGDLFADTTSMAGVRYEDPDGGRRYCHNTKVADLRIQILKKNRGVWEGAQTLTAAKTAAFEVVGGSADPRVKLMIP